MTRPEAQDETQRPDAAPVPLEYFAPADPQRVEARGVTASALLLLFSWAPYLCGVVNAAASAKSYVPTITSAHVNASVLFLAVGLLLAVISLVRFVRARHWPGAIAAGAVVLMQVAIAGCIGLA